MASLRIGHGYDVHPLVEKRSFILGGVEIPYSRGLDGHSDADVLVHAIMDALLGAVAQGDIGKLFPPSDPAYAGADSLTLLAEVWSKVRRGGVVDLVNLDSTVVCESPKLAPYIDRMRENLARVLGVTVERVSVKATTTEGLGFVGRGEGVAVHAVCVLAVDG